MILLELISNIKVYKKTFDQLSSIYQYHLTLQK